MIFLRYESFKGYLKAYPVTSILIALNVILFILQLATGGSDRGELTLAWLFYQDVE